MPRVLVVDDDPLVGVRLRGELQRGGFDVTLSNTPVEALPHCAMWPPTRHRDRSEPAAQETLLRAWWQRQAAKGPTAVGARLGP
jgi:CheY-like chemotaxis protein